LATDDAAPVRPRSGVNEDNEFWYEGIEQRELRIQSCADCGRLRHPPCPMCAACHSLNRSWVVASGRGVIYSYVVHHHPPVVGLDTPYVVVLVELEEGIRVVGNLLDGPHAGVAIGSPVELCFTADPRGGAVLPQWRLAGGAGEGAEPTSLVPPVHVADSDSGSRLSAT
jgi:hypothetical protein